MVEGVVEQPPWSVTVRREDVPETGFHVMLEADAPTRDKVAALIGVRALMHLSATFDLTRHGRDGLRVTGEVVASVGQSCVVTLEPIDSEVCEAVDVVLRPAPVAADRKGRQDEDGGEDWIDPDADDPPEPLVDGAVDLGAIATEFLILGIDPYPRKPDAKFEAPPVEDTGGGAFAALEALKRKDNQRG